MSTQVTEEGKTEAEEYDKFECFCKEQREQKTNRIARSQIKLEGLSAQIEDLDGQIASMAEDIDTLTKDQSSLTKAINEATIQRTAEKKENTATIADAAAGKEAGQRFCFVVIATLL